MDAADLAHIVIINLKDEPTTSKKPPIKKTKASELEENDLRKVPHLAKEANTDNYEKLKESGVAGLPDGLLSET